MSVADQQFKERSALPQQQAVSSAPEPSDLNGFAQARFNLKDGACPLLLQLQQLFVRDQAFLQI
jgi:hypothetical protein